MTIKGFLASDIVGKEIEGIEAKRERERAERVLRNPAFAELAEVEPGLAELERHILRIADGARLLRREDPDLVYCANAQWYGYSSTVALSGARRLMILRPALRDQMQRLAGWDARVPALRTQAAYQAAYDHLYRLLPDCHGCACF